MGFNSAFKVLNRYNRTKNNLT